MVHMYDKTNTTQYRILYSDILSSKIYTCILNVSDINLHRDINKYSLSISDILPPLCCFSQDNSDLCSNFVLVAKK